MKVTDSDRSKGTSTGINIPKFHGKRGEDNNLCTARLCAVCRIKNAWHIIEPIEEEFKDDKCEARISRKSRNVKKEKASGMIISALGNAPLRIVINGKDDPTRTM